MSERNPYIPKGSKYYCLGCKVLMLKAAVDLFDGEIIHEYHFDNINAHLKEGELIKCKKCEAETGRTILIKEFWEILV